MFSLTQQPSFSGLEFWLKEIKEVLIMNIVLVLGQPICGGLRSPPHT